uniref:YL1_C domain-containing protein n=1 Tax=Rhabditophanes sp. KR3021 TaxID=114890 RepID=A0AC35TQ36_9BILA
MPDQKLPITPTEKGSNLSNANEVPKCLDKVGSNNNPSKKLSKQKLQEKSLLKKPHRQELDAHENGYANIDEIMQDMEMCNKYSKTPARPAAIGIVQKQPPPAECNNQYQYIALLASQTKLPKPRTGESFKPYKK